ncbi:MAG TPA: DUF262 domain-containing protein, partial [Tepidisphaeraceae bacterium]
SPRVRDLLDSLYRGYPSGAILLWETDEAVPLQAMAVAQAETPFTTKRLLLDGQQRLTSLSAVIRGRPISVRNRQRPVELLFNLEHPERQLIVTEVDEDAEEEGPGPDEIDATTDELSRRFEQMTFVVATNKLAALPQWVRVSDVFKSDSDSGFLKRAGVTSFDDPRFEKYTQRLARLRNVKRYSYRMDVLERSLTYEEVTEIFVRVNSLGAKLRSSDLALAQITARWRHSLEIFQRFQSECTKTGFDLELGIHLKALVAFATGQSRFQTVGSLTLERLQQAWSEAEEGMRFAINFLKCNVGIDSSTLLSSPFLMIVLAYLGHKRGYALTPEEAAQLRRWTLLVSAKGRFSRGSTETILDQDLAAIDRGEGVEALIDRVRLQFGRLGITDEDLEGRDQRSSFFKIMYLAFRAGGAKDWTSNLLISLNHSGNQHKIEFHHFFPKSLLTKAGYATREADDIANLTFVSGRTNRKFGDKSPSVYAEELRKVHGTGLLEQQAIPTDPSLWTADRYRSFISTRRRLIADVLNRFLGEEAEVRATEQNDIVAMIAEREHERLEFKSSLRWDLQEQRVNKELERVILKSIAAFSNAQGGHILIGVSDDGSVCGLNPDYASLGGDRDAFERHLRALVANSWGDSLAIRMLNLSFHQVEHAELCALKVARGEQPLFLTIPDKNGVKAEKFYVRAGNASSPIEAPSQLAAYISRRFPLAAGMTA